MLDRTHLPGANHSGPPTPDDDEEPEYLYEGHEWLDPDWIARKIDRARDDMEWSDGYGADTDVP